MAIKPDSITRGVLDDIWYERNRQYEKLEESNLLDCADPAMMHPNKYMVLGEEVGEVANCILEAGFGAMTKEKFEEALYKELVQVAAVATAWAESLKRQFGT